MRMMREVKKMMRPKRKKKKYSVRERMRRRKNIR